MSVFLFRTGFFRHCLSLFIFPAWMTVLIFFLVPTDAVAREKSDIITLVNGDRITGEVKQLLLGVINVKTDAMGTVAIEWAKVTRLESRQIFEIEDQDGEKYYGFLTPADETGEFQVILADGTVVSLQHNLIIRIQSIESAWIERWSGYVDLGFSYTNANSASSFSFSSSATYRSKKYKLDLDLGSAISERSDVPRTSWTTLSSSYTHFMKRRWIWAGFMRFESNDELDLKLRSSVGGGFGRYIFQTHRSQFGLLAGLTANQEQYFQTESTVDSNQWTLEALLEAKYEFFVFGHRDTRLSLSLTAFPGISEWGRFRMEVNASLRREFFHNFTLGLTIYDTYDSAPPSTDFEKNNIHIQTSLGWTF